MNTNATKIDNAIARAQSLNLTAALLEAIAETLPKKEAKTVRANAAKFYRDAKRIIMEA